MQEVLVHCPLALEGTGGSVVSERRGSVRTWQMDYAERAGKRKEKNGETMRDALRL